MTTNTTDFINEAILGAEIVQDAVVPPEYSDVALALRLVKKCGHKLRYVAAWGKWLIWNGKYWQFDDTLAAFDIARDICRSAAAECDEPHVAKRIASAQTVAAVEKLAKADRSIAANIEQWDADPWLLNTPDDVIDLRTGILRPHEASDYMTKITNASPDGECPTWMAFLAKVTDNNSELMDYLRRKAGYCLTGVTKEQDLDFFYGTGGNGKGIFLNTLTAIMNSYAVIANIDSFTLSAGDKHPTDLAMLRGARLATAQETEEGRRWAESRIKMLTGGDPITARFMRQDFFTFMPQFKLIIAGNHKPALRNVDEAIRRRFHLVPFTVTIPESERDKDLPEKLKAEWPGILRWAIEGAKEWHENGLNPPLMIREATAAYLTSEDMMKLWIEECCVLAKNSNATMTDLFAAWQKWAAERGEDSGSMRRFSQNLRAKYPQFEDWQCPVTRRKGLSGIQVIKPTANWENDQ